MTTITLSAGATTLTLDPALLWDDEYRWAAVEQRVEPSLTGALVVDVGHRQAGRPITLRAEDDRSAWITRADMVQLQAWADVPGQQMTLTLRGTARAVLFRHHDGGPFDARPVAHFSDPAPTDWVIATLRFITIE